MLRKFIFIYESSKCIKQKKFAAKFWEFVYDSNKNTKEIAIT